MRERPNGFLSEKNIAMENEGKLKELREAALPLIKYLNEKHHPHVTAIVTPTGVKLVEGLLYSGPILDFLKD